MERCLKQRSIFLQTSSIEQSPRVCYTSSFATFYKFGSGASHKFKVCRQSGYSTDKHLFKRSTLWAYIEICRYRQCAEPRTCAVCQVSILDPRTSRSKNSDTLRYIDNKVLKTFYNHWFPDGKK